MWEDILLCVITAICVATDLHNRKIYNAVVFPGLLIAFIGHGFVSGWGGLGYSLAGLFAGLGILLIPYLMGGIGAGDVKMLALVGALKGPAFVAVASVYMGLIGGLMGIVFLIFRKSTREFFIGAIYALCARMRGVRMPWPVQEKSLAAMLPYGVAIGGGAVATLIARGALPL
ncbi:A24 family peptidase [Paenibacillus alkalitolerans]|uniref:A24 family peptidase n=1 Tax=Paenibacillus alkalitolerans TaxID=2799335 RepID=UPI0018F643EE|nr:prepilin peptidase [Paenibacillus alkalitolerans]